MQTGRSLTGWECTVKATARKLSPEQPAFSYCSKVYQKMAVEKICSSWDSRGSAVVNALKELQVRHEYFEIDSHTDTFQFKYMRLA